MCRPSRPNLSRSPRRDWTAPLAGLVVAAAAAAELVEEATEEMVEEAVVVLVVVLVVAVLVVEEAVEEAVEVVAAAMRVFATHGSLQQDAIQCWNFRRQRLRCRVLRCRVLQLSSWHSPEER